MERPALLWRIGVSNWYVKRGEKRDGPYTSAQMKDMVLKGHLLPIDFVARGDGWEWMPASKVKGLFAAKDGSATSVVPPSASPSPPSTPHRNRPTFHSSDRRTHMAEQWYYARNGKQHGPLTDEELKQVAIKGDLSAADMVWKEGMAEWAAASTIKGLLPASVPPPIRPPVLQTPPAHPVQPSAAAISEHGSSITESRKRIKLAILISAIVNAVFLLSIGLILMLATACLYLPVELGMIVLCVFEFLFYFNADTFNDADFGKKAHMLAIFEMIVGGFSNWISFGCGVYNLIQCKDLPKAS